MCDPSRSQSPHSTAAAIREGDRERKGEHKPDRGKAGQEGGSVKAMAEHSSIVSAQEAKRGAETAGTGSNRFRVESWGMDGAHAVGAGNGVQGGPRASFANAGLVALHTARQTARQSR